MFDPVTAAIVRAAPPLPGLDPAELIDELTAAYVDIASARLALGEQPDDHSLDLAGLVARMGRLADTYEGLIVLDLHAEHRRSAAFVAGSARQVIAQIARLGPDDSGPSRLDEDVVGADIAAALLFLIAEQASDAQEAARSIRAAGEPNPVRRALILALGRFCRGAFSEVAEMDIDRERLTTETQEGYATDLLYRELLRGLQLLAQAGLGLVGDEAMAAADAIFAKVRTLSVEAVVSDSLPSVGVVTAVSVFAGPHHLAALLRRAGKTLAESALVRTPTPKGAAESQWHPWVQGEARRWPFLWRNHREAIATGYLEQGSSLVMTTPTGSGKTTLAALKIAATLAAGKTVLYLAPTHALVGQVERDLNERIQGLATAASIEEVSLDDIIESLPDLAVVTPERCFALLTFAPDLFHNVGLLVFDECHLLGVSKPATHEARARVGRRGIDAMLCLLTFMSINKSADYLLLSAMVSNGAEIADWLRSLLGRPVFPFEDRWKPTRQLRACVAYDQERLDALATSFLPSATPLAVEATPLGLFSLVSGWNSKAPDKLVLRPFSAQPVALKKGAGPWVTSNRGVVAAAIAERFAAAGLKVIVFCENITMCGSVATALNRGKAALTPNYSADLTALREAVLDEVGAASAIYDVGSTRAAVHHGELLPDERRLVETMFRDRESGVNVLAATSTLAQGLNLPCEVVILAGTDRMDEAEQGRTPLQAHEILNALGRAGRAGVAATGLAIVIPGEPLGCRMDTKEVSHEGDVKVVFSESDQCLPLADPLTTLFDQIEVHGVDGAEAEYLLRRLTISLGDERVGVETFESLTRRSFGFYQRVSANPTAAEAWLKVRKASLTTALLSAAKPPALPWQEELAAKTGASSAFISGLAAAYPTAPFEEADAKPWISWLLHRLDPRTDDFDIFLRPETLKRVFGRAYENQVDELARRETAVAGVQIGVSEWLDGVPLISMEGAIADFVAAHEGPVSRSTKADKKAKRARRFAIRMAPDLGFLCGVLVQVAEHLSAEAGTTAPPMVTFLPSLVRRGYRTPYHYLLSRGGQYPSRPAVERIYASIADELDQKADDDWVTVRGNVDRALVGQVFQDLTADELDTVMAAVASQQALPGAVTAD